LALNPPTCKLLFPEDLAGTITGTAPASSASGCRLRRGFSPELLMDNYVRYDENEDVLASTHLLAIVIPRLNQQPSLWKWAVIAAHNALQGAILCALHDSIDVSVLTDKLARAVLKLHDQDNLLQVHLKIIRANS
jgi:hypothetical protein